MSGQKKITHRLTFPDNALTVMLFGEEDCHVKLMEKKLGVEIHPWGNTAAISGSGDAVKKSSMLLKMLYESLEKGEPVDIERVKDGILSVQQESALLTLFQQELILKTPRQHLRPRNPRQARLIKALFEKEVCFALGPAGTGKTYLAVAAAVSAFINDQVQRIILTRPAVEAGERLGFLPGDLQAKVDPYLRPLFDALFDMLGAQRMEKMIEQGTIEIAPLAYMRGRTLQNAFAILDEAQNATVDQIKMFLTRLGHGSRMVVCGDPSQSDLTGYQSSGLAHAAGILQDIDGIHITIFKTGDVVRHNLVEKIVQAFEKEP
ncbi:PhoH family protein [Magnetococcales bacterium HHB-1]